LISARIVHLTFLLIFSSFVLTACQDHSEKPHDNLLPSKSHRVVIEKSVVVPPEVAKRWKAVKIAVIDKTRGTENIYTIPVGTSFSVPSSTLSILVEAMLPSFSMEGTTITSSSNELLNPGVKVKISDNGSSVFQGWIFLKFPNTHAVSHPKYGFTLIGVVPVRK
jgi:hypothetical protein